MSTYSSWLEGGGIGSLSCRNPVTGHLDRPADRRLGLAPFHSTLRTRMLY